MQAIVQSLSQGLGTLFSYIPVLIGAIVILIVGYVIAKVLQAVVTRLLGAIGFEGWMERGGIKQFFDRANTQQTPSSIIGKLVFWLVFVIAITMATDALGISAVSATFAQLIAYIPNIIAAVLILVLAALAANFVAGIVRGATGIDVLGTVAQVAILVYAGFAALTQLGIAVQLTAPTLLILLGAVALALALAFGLGGREIAADILNNAYSRGGEAREKVQQQRQQQGGSSGSGSSRSGSAGRRAAREDIEGGDEDVAVRRTGRR